MNTRRALLQMFGFGAAAATVGVPSIAVESPRVTLDFVEWQIPSTVNDSARRMMAALARFNTKQG